MHCVIRVNETICIAIRLYELRQLMSHRLVRSYKNRIYTANAVGFEGIHHIPMDAAGNKDFTTAINQVGGHGSSECNRGTRDCIGSCGSSSSCSSSVNSGSGSGFRRKVVS
jgi:hypothetical protein